MEIRFKKRCQDRAAAGRHQPTSSGGFSLNAPGLDASVPFSEQSPLVKTRFSLVAIVAAS
jgi:hypothetical protein